MVNPSLTLDSPGVHGFLSVFDSHQGHALLKKRPVAWSVAVMAEEAANEVLLAMQGPDARQSDPFHFDGVYGFLIGMRPWRGLLQTVATGRTDTGIGPGLSARAAQTPAPLRHAAPEAQPERVRVSPRGPRAARARNACGARGEGGGEVEVEPIPTRTGSRRPRRRSASRRTRPGRAAEGGAHELDGGGTPPRVSMVNVSSGCARSAPRRPPSKR